VRPLLERDFDLKFERGTNNAYYEGTDDIWEWFARGFGPVRELLERLGPAERKAFKSDVDAYHRHYATDAGLHVRRDYLIVIGRRR
jgi:hypothetical protein